MQLQRFFDFLFPPRADEKLVRDASIDDFLTHLAPALVSETRPATTALLPFHHGLVRGAIHEAKYHGSEKAFSLLAAALADHLRDLDLFEQNRKVCVVPVPLGPGRLQERGFNQAEEVVKRALVGTPLTLESDLLTRVRETTSQVSLAREKREANMRGAFRAAHPDPSCTYLLIDDVITTGATLQAAADALRSAGARDLHLLALAH